MFTRLLVGLDGSPNADEALEQAVHLGLRFKSRVVVAYVKEMHFTSSPPRTSDSGALLAALEREGTPAAAKIGRLTRGAAGAITVS